MNLISELSALTAEPPAELLDRVVARWVRYLGSDTTGVVCFPTCANARRITPAHRREFRSVPEAISAGYRPCRRCRPAQDESGRVSV